MSSTESGELETASPITRPRPRRVVTIQPVGETKAFPPKSTFGQPLPHPPPSRGKEKKRKSPKPKPHCAVYL